jgi:3-methyladenine DNA glycosylase Mpg
MFYSINYKLKSNYKQGEVIEDARVTTSPRIGVSGDELAKTIAWRWFVRDSAFVSHRPASKRPA